ncbi:hypothetical protein THAOC_30512 [Thalassiosira oceanica]|uniref:Importin N-terminal domain-containing protein n=1 Tax=Thalassiosira oceanica TaxID=159749 RepID=K0RUV5_THAOC|nr:hypothetical protein THAOC_30512 [Thalassiosira oceanica]|eukprot:EJK50502.1 hypothetical protein THAOC_30512 [Thalassiosira oceanica]
MPLQLPPPPPPPSGSVLALLAALSNHDPTNRDTHALALRARDDALSGSPAGYTDLCANLSRALACHDPRTVPREDLRRFHDSDPAMFARCAGWAVADPADGADEASGGMAHWNALRQLAGLLLKNALVSPPLPRDVPTDRLGRVLPGHARRMALDGPGAAAEIQRALASSWRAAGRRRRGGPRRRTGGRAGGHRVAPDVAEAARGYPPQAHQRESRHELPRPRARPPRLPDVADRADKEGGAELPQLSRRADAGLPRLERGRVPRRPVGPGGRPESQDPVPRVPRHRHAAGRPAGVPPAARRARVGVHAQEHGRRRPGRGPRGLRVLAHLREPGRRGGGDVHDGDGAGTAAEADTAAVREHGLPTREDRGTVGEQPAGRAGRGREGAGSQASVPQEQDEGRGRRQRRRERRRRRVRRRQPVDPPEVQRGEFGHACGDVRRGRARTAPPPPPPGTVPREPRPVEEGGRDTRPGRGVGGVRPAPGRAHAQAPPVPAGTADGARQPAAGQVHRGVDPGAVLVVGRRTGRRPGGETRPWVQVAVTSSLGVFADAARELLVPYLGGLYKVIVHALDTYGTRSRLVLLDAMGVIAECVGQAVGRDGLPAMYVPRMLRMWNDLATADPFDRSLLPLMECLGSHAVYIGLNFQPWALETFEMAMSTIEACMIMIAHDEDDLDDVDDEMTDPIICAIDLTDGLVEGLGPNFASLVESSPRFGPTFPSTVRGAAIHAVPGVRMSAYALVGDLARHAPALIQDVLPELLKGAIESMTPMHPSLCNNAAWAIGEICVRCGSDPAPLRPYAPGILSAVVPLLVGNAVDVDGNEVRVHGLAENGAITMGRLACVDPGFVAQDLPRFLVGWCDSMSKISDHVERNDAFRGFVAALRANPGSISGGSAGHHTAGDALGALLFAIVSWHLEGAADDALGGAYSFAPFPSQHGELLDSLKGVASRSQIVPRGGLGRGRAGHAAQCQEADGGAVRSTGILTSVNICFTKNKTKRYASALGQGQSMSVEQARLYSASSLPSSHLSFSLGM